MKGTLHRPTCLYLIVAFIFALCLDIDVIVLVNASFIISKCSRMRFWTGYGMWNKLWMVLLLLFSDILLKEALQDVIPH